MPRSATKSIAVLLKTLGFPSYHHSIGAVQHERAFIPYKLEDTDKWAKWIKAKAKRIHELSDADGNYFESTWELSYVICVLYRYFPNMEFFILVRDITEASNSLRHYRSKRESAESVDHYAEAWIRVYSFICDQLQHCRPTAYLLDFAKYTQGEYTDFLLRYFGIDRTGSNLEKIRNILGTKVNTRGEYETTQISEELVSEAGLVRNRLQSLCLEIRDGQ